MKRGLTVIAVTSFLLALITGSFAQTETFTNFVLSAPAGNPTSTDVLPCIESNGATFLTRQCTLSSLLSIITAQQIKAALGYTPLNPANNLSDVSNTSTAATNLGIGGAGSLGVGVGLTSSGGNLNLLTSSTSTIGGVLTFGAVAHQWITSLSTLGVFTSSQPAAADLSNGVTGSGLVVLATGGILTSTQVNGVTLQGGTSTLTIANNKAVVISNSITFAGADTTTMNFPTSTAHLGALDLTNQQLSGGINLTSFSIGTLSSGTTTINFGNSPSQFLTNNGSFAIAAPSNDGSCLLLITNGASPGTITFSGFTVGANTGDSFDTTTAHKFTVSIWRINGISAFRIAALQ